MRIYVVLLATLLLTACGGGEPDSQSKPTESLPEAKHEAGGAAHTHEHEPSESLAKAMDDTEEEHAKKHQDAKYVCPMHPEVVSDEPGSCPICGMFLVKKEVEPESQEDAKKHLDTQ